jgi:effector-binding domain-containing protein
MPMSDEPVVETATVKADPIAARDARTTRADLAATIRSSLDDVWKFVRESGDLDPRHNVVVYKGDPGAGPADVEVGVQVGRRFDGTSPTGVRCSELPAGRVARAMHRGPYDQMAPTYEAIENWAQKTGQTFSGPSWEIYGDWHEDPAELEVEIVFMIAPVSGRG